jgi:hypothetical protein
MKQNESKQLTLKKKTVANLSNVELKSLQGAQAPDVETLCGISCETQGVCDITSTCVYC